MSLFLLVFAVLYAATRARTWLRDWFTPWYETRLQEQAQGLPRGSLAERWGHDENWISDDAWCRLLKHINRVTRMERNQLLRQRNSA